jgi:NADH:ubiquinone oxidoreductase subunit K
MKDIILSSKRQKAEILWFVVCFCVAVLLNVFAIFLYKTSWSELYTQFLWILIITCVLYAVSVGIRWIVYLVRRLF